jgi:hypothetical protein
MKKIIWIPLVILIIGICIALAGFANGGMKSLWFDRAGFHVENGSQGNLVTVDETYTSFNNIEINAGYIKSIVFKEGDDFAVRGQNYERYGGLDVNQNGDTIIINTRTNENWHINMGIGETFNDENNSWLEVTYPAGTKLGVIKTNLSAGIVNINKINCTDLNIDNDFGDVELDNIRTVDLHAELSSGRLKITNVFADTVSLDNDFGKIEVNGMEVKRLKTDLNAGDFDANDISADDLTVESDFGKVEMNKLTFTGKCEVKNNSGDIRLNILLNRDAVSYELDADVGSITIDGQKSTGSVSNRPAEGTAFLDAETDFGAISVNFLG